MTTGDTGAQGAGAPPAGAQDAQFNIVKIYAKDLSFETPNSPEVFTAEWKPDVDLHLHTEAKQVANDQFEVVLTVTVTVKIGESTAFLAEVHMAGIFVISGVTSEQAEPLLGCVCPGILFPYARELVSDLTTRGGFPQCVLAPVNFEALYQQHRSADRQAAEVEDAPGVQ